MTARHAATAGAARRLAPPSGIFSGTGADIFPSFQHIFQQLFAQFNTGFDRNEAQFQRISAIIHPIDYTITLSNRLIRRLHGEVLLCA
jgi:hypothetical protein